jgi:hypothetical protein
MDASATHPLDSSARTLAGTAGAFLLPRFLSATRNFAAGFGIVRAKARICHLADIRLVHQVYINFGFEDGGGQFHRLHLLAFHVENVCFHF